jgi:SAM-dependent methyltransferase
MFFLVLFAMVGIFKSFLHKKEAFTDNISVLNTTNKYMLKRNQDVYDDFYATVYSKMESKPSRVKEEVSFIEKQTQPSKETSVLLDMGAGTGEVMNEWLNRGYKQVYGIEQSPTMVASSIYPDQTIQSDFMLRNNFERSTFTHIFCLNHTIYEIENKVAFFKNCYFWLKPGGYLVVHLTEKPRINTTKPLKTESSCSSLKGLDYKAELNPSTDSNSILLTEYMTDRQTGQMRTQERDMYMKEIGDIVNDAIYCGFIIHGKASIQTSTVPISQREYMYFFQK